LGKKYLEKLGNEKVVKNEQKLKNEKEVNNKVNNKNCC
jgi:hypothetical protein